MMTFRRHPPVLYAIALAIFSLTAILPVGYMLTQFVISLLQQPSTITKMTFDTRQLILLSRSLAIASSATMVALALGLPTAIILAAKDLPLRKLFHFLVLIPVLIPSYVMAGAWLHLLSPSGFINQSLTNWFGPSARISLPSAMGCVWCLGISFFPVIAIIVATGLSELDSNLTDIARLSTNRLGVFRHAILPQILPHLSASICLVTIFVLAQYGVPSLLGINTYPVEIFAQFSAFYDDNGAVATALPLILLVVVLILLQRQIMRNRTYVRIMPSSETAGPIKMNNLKNYAVTFLIAMFVITTVLPFFSVLIHAQSFTKIWHTLRSFDDSILTTSLLALSAAVISTLIAFPIGHYLAHNSGRFNRLIDLLCWLPIAIPGTIIGLGLIKLANGVPLLRKGDSLGILLLLAYIGMFSAFSIRIFEASCRSADPNVTEAAAIDCPRWYHSLFHIDIPIHSGAIAVSLIVVFVLVAGELNATVLLIPPGKATLAVAIDNLLHYGANATASALCLIEAGFVIFAITCGLFMFTATKRILS